ncbi:MAG: uncharacterized protein JWP91_3196 [Fibrobacteres bacterium]|nr:uncharacterized protein [Fibrobacterota bacterium]
MHSNRHVLSCALVSLICLGSLPRCARAASECDGWQVSHPDWIFCDDFEKGGALVAQGRYFEYDDNKGDFKPAEGVGLHGSTGMRAVWQSAEVDAGNLKVGFGRAPSTYFSKGIRTDKDFREVYYRMFVRLQKGWKGNPFKLSRATVIAKADWSQAMIAHVWGDRANGLQLDPARCTDEAGAVKCSGYNDFNNIQWIGAKAGTTPVFSPTYSDKWLCVEAHVRLNDPGISNGVQEYWIGDTLEAKRDGLNFLGGYKAYGINGVFLENYWNSGSPQLQERYFDNLVVSTNRIGCADNSGAPAILPIPEAGSTVPAEPQGALNLKGIPAAEALGRAWSMTGRELFGRKIKVNALVEPNTAD